MNMRTYDRMGADFAEAKLLEHVRAGEHTAAMSLATQCFFAGSLSRDGESALLDFAFSEAPKLYRIGALECLVRALPTSPDFPKRFSKRVLCGFEQRSFRNLLSENYDVDSRWFDISNLPGESYRRRLWLLSLIDNKKYTPHVLNHYSDTGFPRELLWVYQSAYSTETTSNVLHKKLHRVLRSTRLNRFHHWQGSEVFSELLVRGLFWSTLVGYSDIAGLAATFFFANAVNPQAHCAILASLMCANPSHPMLARAMEAAMESNLPRVKLLGTVCNLVLNGTASSGAEILRRELIREPQDVSPTFQVLREFVLMGSFYPELKEVLSDWATDHVCKSLAGKKFKPFYVDVGFWILAHQGFDDLRLLELRERIGITNPLLKSESFLTGLDWLSFPERRRFAKALGMIS